MEHLPQLAWGFAIATCVGRNGLRISILLLHGLRVAILLLNGLRVATFLLTNLRVVTLRATCLTRGSKHRINLRILFSSATTKFCNWATVAEQWRTAFSDSTRHL